MAHEDEPAELDELSPENLDAYRRSVAAINAAYDGICADATTICEWYLDAATTGLTTGLIDAFSGRLAAFRLMLAAFESLATLLPKTGRDALLERIARSGAQATWRMFMISRVVPAAELRGPSDRRPEQQPPKPPRAEPPAAQQPAAQQPAEDPEEAAKLRAIQRAIDADNRATTMKIFEIQRQAQQDAHESMQRIHDSQDKMKLDGGERT